MLKRVIGMTSRVKEKILNYASYVVQFATERYILF
jgi:hypothetical protein